jgi:hypothetical protein
MSPLLYQLSYTARKDGKLPVCLVCLSASDGDRHMEEGCLSPSWF